MAIVRPFRAVRPSAEKAEETIALPYDVMNRAEAAEMAKGKPCSFLHISRSEIDLPEVADPYSIPVYEKARDNIAKNLKEGNLIQEDRPAFYIYRQTMDGREQTGIVGCVSIDEYENNKIKKHELTRYEKEVDRINHFDTCNANTEPVFLTYRDDEAIRELVEEFADSHSPVYDFTGGDGVGHTLWVVDERHIINAISAFFSAIPALYIADGHHRSASAYEVGKKRRTEHPDYTGDEEFNYFMAAIFPDTDLKIFDYNRVVKDLNGHTTESFLEAVHKAGFDIVDYGEYPKKTGEKGCGKCGDKCSVEVVKEFAGEVKVEALRPRKLHEFSMYLEGHWYKLTARPEIIPDDVIEGLDVSILQNELLAPILGIGDPRLDKRIDFVGGIRGLAELRRRTQTDMKVAFAVYPVTCQELMHIADCGKIMPPKSTWFEPKLGSGLFVHQL